MATALVDIGVNLAHHSYERDRAAVIERAQTAGVGRMVVTGSSLASTRGAIELVRRHPGLLRATAGVHPHHAADLTEQKLSELEALMRAPEVAAAGEMGLDYFRNLAPHAAQERAFRWQLELAVRTGRPAFLHQRDAHADFVRILGDYLPQLPAAVAHCFTGNAQELEHYLGLGLYIGITGWICDERRGQQLAGLVASIPTDRLMIETDGPYLLPRDLAPKPAMRRNEPMFLPHILATVARHRGVTVDALAAATTANAMRFFNWPW